MEDVLDGGGILTPSLEEDSVDSSGFSFEDLVVFESRSFDGTASPLSSMPLFPSSFLGDSFVSDPPSAAYSLEDGGGNLSLGATPPLEPLLGVQLKFWKWDRARGLC
jgi:hypothetical protein